MCKSLTILIEKLKKKHIKNKYNYSNLLVDTQYRNDLNCNISNLKCEGRKSKSIVFQYAIKVMLLSA